MTTEPQPTPPAATGAQPRQAPGPEAPPLPHHRLKRTRTGGVWVAVAFFVVVLLFLLIFILQNEEKVHISYLGAQGHLPLGVAMLLAAVGGALLVILAGAARIGQLRFTARRHRRADAKHVAAVKSPDVPAR
ncbi:MAG: DUF1049 domain-containing protein [Streptosporangiaceae bacterium]|nr:DUF1049 domain-containing protein [Streptosporangiaceae bacterium]